MDNAFVDMLNECANDGNLSESMFMSMGDRALLSYFVNVRGVDYDRARFNLEECLKAELNYKTDLETVEILYTHPSMPARNLYQSDCSSSSNSTESNTPANSPHLFGKPIQEKQSLLRLVNDHLTADGSEDANATNAAKKGPPTAKPGSEQGTGRVVKKRKPRTYKYNPKPMFQKESRSFVPDDLKDKEYWNRRKRNNLAAKKSREERRKKELEIMNEYHEMKNECEDVKNENDQMKLYIDRLERKLEELQKESNNNEQKCISGKTN